MTVEIDFRPMQVWHGRQPEYQAKRWKKPLHHTLAMLKEELERNEIDNALLETYHSRDDLKMNGLPKSGAVPSKPGVQLWFKINDTPICLSCNRFADWDENFKAAQMTLRSRRLERDYGCANMEEQYRGHAQLPAGKTKLPESTICQQAHFIIGRSKLTDVPMEKILEDKDEFNRVYKIAASKTHPDRGLDGSEELMTALNNARVAIIADRGW